MTRFELGYRIAEPFLSPLYVQVRRATRAAMRAAGMQRVRLLDVGGRKSHYTVGLAERVVVSDVPRTSTVQEELQLGVTAPMLEQLRRRRSNIEDVVLDDMTQSALPNAAFDVVLAVEVLEHVDEDAAFVAQVARVLRPGGIFVMTTPNGDAVPVPHNTDHRRHYPKAALEALLRAHFAEVEVRYAIRQSAFRRAGLRPWSVRTPLRTAASMLGNVVCLAHSSARGAARDRLGTRHLLAVCRVER